MKATLLIARVMITTCLVATPALAIDPAVRQVIDAQGVDLFNGRMALRARVLSIGGDHGLGYEAIYQDNYWGDNIAGSLTLNGSYMYVSFNGFNDRFAVSGSTYTPTEGSGSSLNFDSGSQVFTYTSRDGTVVTFNKIYKNLSGTNPYGNQGMVTSITRPNGERYSSPITIIFSVRHIVRVAIAVSQATTCMLIG